MNADITVEISTRDRYESLILTLQSIALQTCLPKCVLIYDDGQQKDLRQDYVYGNIFKMLSLKGIQWKVLFGERKGQVLNHQKAINESQTELIYRCDDDNTLEPNVLERLYAQFRDPKVGAVAGVVSHPDGFLPPEATSPFIEDSLFKYSIQFTKFDSVREVQHLYSTFMFRKSAAKHGYNLSLSKVGHREETLFSHEMFRNGWKLLVDGNAIIWHLKAPTGGIRSFKDINLWNHDETKYLQKTKEWGIKLKDYFFCYLNNGIGDHFVFKRLLPEIKAKHPNKKIFISACYPNVFFDEPDVETVGLNVGQCLSRRDILDYDVYKYGFDNKWNKPIEGIFRKIYEL